MFKKKQKKSHKNDEIFVDYSKDIDVKKTDEDEAKPEHYEALEVDDEIVVSPNQIKEAKQQKEQDQFIQEKQRENASSIDRKVIESKEKHDEFIHNIDQQEPPKKQDDHNEKQENNTTVIEYHFDEEHYVLEEFYEASFVDVNEEEKTVQKADVQRSITEEQKTPIKTGNSIKDNCVIEDEIVANKEEKIEEKNKEKSKQKIEDHPYRNYPSFLHEELSQRRNIETPEQVVGKKEKGVKQEDAIVQKEKDTLDLQDDLDEMEKEDTKYSPIDDVQVQKQDLDRYFTTDKSVLKRGAKKYQKKKETKKITKKPVYTYKHHAFYDMDDFISFLEDKLYSIDAIANDVLKDEHFFRWLKQESSQFEESVLKMKKLKQELKQ